MKSSKQVLHVHHAGFRYITHFACAKRERYFMEFCERLRLLRKEKGLTQKEAAAELGVSYRAYQCYEYSQRCPDLHGLIAISNYFDVSLDFLVGQSDVRERR